MYNIWKYFEKGQVIVCDYRPVTFKCIPSAISRAVLKLVYWFGIPNSNPQMLKSVDFWCKLLSTFLVAKPREPCFELLRTQNSQKFPGFHPWTPLGRAYSTTPDSPAAQRFFSSLRLLKNWHPQKLLDMALIPHVKYIWQSLLIMVDFDALSSLWFPPWSSCFEASCLRVIAEVLNFPGWIPYFEVSNLRTFA